MNLLAAQPERRIDALLHDQPLMSSVIEASQQGQVEANNRNGIYRTRNYRGWLAHHETANFLALRLCDPQIMGINLTNLQHSFAHNPFKGQHRLETVGRYSEPTRILLAHGKRKAGYFEVARKKFLTKCLVHKQNASFLSQPGLFGSSLQSVGPQSYQRNDVVYQNIWIFTEVETDGLNALTLATYVSFPREVSSCGTTVYYSECEQIWTGSLNQSAPTVHEVEPEVAEEFGIEEIDDQPDEEAIS